MSMQPPPAAMPPAGPVAPPAQPAGEDLSSPEVIQQIAEDTGYAPEQIQQDIARTGATTRAELYPNVYGNTGIDPQAAQVGGGYAPDDSQDMPQAPSAPMGTPMAADPNPRRARAQRAMAGQPEEMSEPQGMQSAAPAGEMAEDRSALGTMAQMRAGHMAPHKVKRGARHGMPTRRGY